ncbi:major facilitator superfamily protein [Sarocladium implicatum]|nr:major facilitator superfamily protein [Sarocladium implicatum]
MKSNDSCSPAEEQPSEDGHKALTQAFPNDGGLEAHVLPDTGNNNDSQDHEQDLSPTLEAVASSRSVYARFSPRRKAVIMAVISYCGFLTPILSTAILVAVPEVAATFNSTGVVINMSNALFFVFMAISPLFWGPMAQSVGRRRVFIAASVMLTAFTAGTAAAPNVGAYFVFRMLSAFQGTAFLVVGTVVIGDVYHPTERGRALGAFLSGLLIGPSIAPLLGGAVITFTTWRVIYWVMTGLAGLATVMVIFLLPETILERPTTFENLSVPQKVGKAITLSNPWKVVHPLLVYPNLWITALAVSALIWNQYSTLTPIRYVLNPRFQLTSPMQSALFFLPSGIGCFIGTFVGGRWSDFIVARYQRRRNRRVPEDRLNSSVLFLLVFVPSCSIIYGWAVEKRAGGIPLVVIALFMQGFTQLCALPSLNTYLIDVLQDKGQSSVAVAGNYLSRFLFAAAGSAACLPAIQVIGVGWFSTLSGLFITATGGLVWLLTLHGEKWRLRTGKTETEAMGSENDDMTETT